MSSKTLILTSSGLKNVIVSPSDNEEFSFIFSKESITIPKIFAQFISPKVCKLHKTDQTIQSISFTDELKDTVLSKKILSIIKSLSMGESIEINEEESFELQIISILLENEELFIKINKIFQKDINENNIDQYLKNLQILDKITTNSNLFNYSDIEFISKHFYLIDKEKLLQLSKRVLFSIITNESLTIESEDSLFDFIIQLFNNHEKEEKAEINLISFLEQVHFENLSEEKLSRFLDNFNPNEMTVALWSKLRPCIHCYNTDRLNNSRYIFKIKSIEYDGKISNSLNGIIDYLTNESGGNVSDNGTVKVTSISEQSFYQAKNVVDLYNAGNGFISNNVGNVWLKYDFIEKKICPTCYTIKSRHNSDAHHPRSWVIEGSNTDEESDWEILDKQDNNETLHGKNTCYTFKINEQDKYYRYLRIRQTGKNSNGYDYFCFAGLEYFGKIRNDSAK